MCMFSTSTYFYFRLGPYGQTMAGSLSPADPSVAFLLPVPISIPLTAPPHNTLPCVLKVAPFRTFCDSGSCISLVLCDNFDSWSWDPILKQARLKKGRGDSPSPGISLWFLVPHLDMRDSACCRRVAGILVLEQASTVT